MYRIEWDDDTIDVLQKVNGQWQDITIIPKKQTLKIGQLIDDQLKNESCMKK
jgi:hypothetical protein